MDEQRPDLEAELSGLKDFQRRTVEHVHARLWDPKDPARRFLVADEVGLGKTLVARGVIAKTIDDLWDNVPRIDIVYICSNTQIARQNLPKLRVGTSESMAHADRLTMLATELRNISGRKLNFVSFTPGTSFQVGTSGGRAPERVLLYWLLREAWGGEVSANAWLKFFRGGSGLDRFTDLVRWFDRGDITEDLAVKYAAQVAGAIGPGGQPLAGELRETVGEFKFHRSDWEPPTALSKRRNRLIGRLRQLLARTAVEALQPDLVIMDEFQRFKDLMHGQDEGADLAHALFDHGKAKLLLLSATPYKMYTLPDEPEGDDHYKDFVDTIGFLAGTSKAADIEAAMSSMRSSLFAGEVDAAKEAKHVAEAALRRVMVRTERLASTPDRDGMISELAFDGVVLQPNDVRDYRRLARTSKVVSGFDPMEFWRSAPYVLELMEQYQLKKKLEAHPGADAELIAAVREAGNLLSWNDLLSYQKIDPANAKMRGLVKDVLDRGAWRLVWLPPAMPYYTLAGAYDDPQLRTFTKRLVFSAWTVVPKAISTVLSYEAERRLMETSNIAAAKSYTVRAKPLLNFARSDGRLTGMQVLGMLYPCVTLAEIGDPLVVAREMELTLPLERDLLVGVVSKRVRAALDELPAGPASGATDDRWYWAAGMLLDNQRDDLGETDVDSFNYGLYETDVDTESRFDDHASSAKVVRPEELGRRPADLVELLTRQAIAGFGICALRSLSRLVGGPTMMRDRDVRDAASCMAWSLRGLFNGPEVMTNVRAQSINEESYWREVLNHCLDGGLQPVVDEYLHTLTTTFGAASTSVDEMLRSVIEDFDRALSLRTAVNDFSELTISHDEFALVNHKGLRSHLAVRFGRGVAEDSTAQREGLVRAAFNSPFWPFVLASTSVGQEGLDFHHYSHAVVHWNLPRNPVDLEQREGRVHRYKGHAVRKNVAAAYGSRREVVDADNPWDAAFDLASNDRPDGESEIFPFWVFPDPDGAHIERYVPALPLSGETHRRKRLMRTVGAYRLVIGQPRQEDLLKYLGEQAGELLDELKIDLSPGAD